MEMIFGNVLCRVQDYVDYDLGLEYIYKYLNAKMLSIKTPTIIREVILLRCVCLGVVLFLERERWPSQGTSGCV